MWLSKNGAMEVQGHQEGWYPESAIVTRTFNNG